MYKITNIKNNKAVTRTNKDTRALLNQCEITDSILPLPFMLDNITERGGYYILVLPLKWKNQISDNDIKSAKHYIKSQYDAVSIKIKWSKFN